MIHRIISFLTSLRLTVVCLALALVLVFVGTLAQVELGLYAVQSEYFRSFFVCWTPPGTHLKIPFFPGGWLIGLVLLVNLLAAHIKRFQFSRKKIGIILIHAGLILLLGGQFMTEMFQVESQMRLAPGDTKNYSESDRKNELAVIDTTDKDKDRVVAIPESLVAKGGEIRTPALPFTLKVEKYFRNSDLAGPMTGDSEKINSTDGIGKKVMVAPRPTTRTMDTVDMPTALVQVEAGNKPLGQWVVSTLFTRYPIVSGLQSEIGGILPDVKLTAPQTFQYKGRSYEIALRPIRYYVPYSIKLLAFNHDLYPGTEIPKNFSSKIHLTDPAAGDDRDILIYMNNPLRYHGATFYQASFEKGDVATILQVVRNPAAITPYLACSLVALGLVTQFLMHLFGFARKRLQQTNTAPAKTTRKAPAREPALAQSKGRAA